MNSSERALILAPQGRDSILAASLLEKIGQEAHRCDDFQSLLGSLEEGAGMAIVAIEALQHFDLSPLLSWIDRQPAWSDFPFVILSHRVSTPEQHPMLRRLKEIAGNVIFLERPFHPDALTNVVENALRGRRRQYQARSSLEERESLLRQLAVEKERTQDALRGEQALSALLLTSVPAGIVAYDFDLNVTIWNPVMERLLGIPAQNAIGSSLVRLLGDGNAALIGSRLKNALNGIAGPVEEIGVQDHLGGHLFLESQHAPLRGGDGEIAGGAAFFRDISERRQIEEQLRQSQKMETIGQLTGGVAHDFNNLLAAIQGNLELLRKRLQNDPSAMRYVEGALQGTGRGATLTARLLAFARKQELNPQPTDLAQLLRGMKGLIERSVGPLIEVHLKIGSNLPPARVDLNQLEMAVLNLCVNSRDAMPDGGRLDISVETRDGAMARAGLHGPFLVIGVSDTGFGMDEATAAKAIEPFFSTKELGKGTGLGLSMVHGLAQQLGGAVRLHSQLGHGTTAEIWLPVTDQPIVSESAPTVEPSDVPPSRILVVDDDALIAMNTVALVEDLGHVAVEANSGRKALEILASGEAIDAMITDFAMPGMNGVELAGKARAMRPELPILLASGYAELPSGLNLDLPRLGKPFMQSDLAAKLTELLS